MQSPQFQRERWPREDSAAAQGLQLSWEPRGRGEFWSRLAGAPLPWPRVGFDSVVATGRSRAA